jgi:V8-like Glu-specific endopeptidase
MDYYSNSQLRQINFTRATLKGNLLDINDNTLYHNLDTSTGHSGSGILGINNKTKHVTVLGVHTHKGRKRNSGVFLSNFLLKRMARYEI